MKSTIIKGVKALYSQLNGNEDAKIEQNIKLLIVNEIEKSIKTRTGNLLKVRTFKLQYIQQFAHFLSINLFYQHQQKKEIEAHYDNDSGDDEEDDDNDISQSNNYEDQLASSIIRKVISLSISLYDNVR